MMIARASVYRDLDSRDVHVCPLQKLSNKTCLVCCEGGNVFSCGNGNCSIVVHESCIPCGARFGKNGEFYCPYCFYKQSLIECRQAKEKTLLARKALSNFLDVNTIMEMGCNKIHNDIASHKPMQVDNECAKLPSRGEEQQEARLPTSSRCRAEGSVSKEAGNLNRDPLETLNKFKAHHSGSLGKQHTEIELQGASVNLISNPERKDMNGEPDKGSKGGLRDNIYVRNQTAMTSKNAEHPAKTFHPRGRTEEGGKSRERSRKHAIHPMMTDSAFATPGKLGNLEQQENATVVEEYSRGGAQKKRPQALQKKSSVSLAKDDDKVKRHKETNHGNNSLDGNRMAVDCKADELGEERGGHMKRTHKAERKVILPEKDAHPIRDTVPGTHEEAEAGDHSASSHHSCNTGTLKNDNKHEKLLESSEFEFSEHEDHQVVTSGRQIVDSSKWNKHPTLPKRKRSPLRWTAEEVDMLKEDIRGPLS